MCEPQAIKSIYIRSIIQAILAAALFGAGTPLAKLMLGKIEPIPLAALLYLGSGIGVLVFLVIRHMLQPHVSAEAPLDKSDTTWLAGAILAGGVAAPIVLMFSLNRTPAATASLLLNFEGIATAMIAAILFKESVGKRIWIATAFISIAGILLTIKQSDSWGISISTLGVVLSCVLWGIDNNFTRNISGKDPLRIVALKGLCAGLFSLALSFVVNQTIPPVGNALSAMALGSISYGASIVLFILAMRGLGAARTSAYFASAPFIGTVLSIILFRGLPNLYFLASLPFMVIGALLLIGEQHSHEHSHTAIEHDHRHRHDDSHHRHSHHDALSTDKTHSHWHQHEGTTHTHAHMPDIHHRHEHNP